MKGNDQKYNFQDFARYHSGQMPPDEMHALEKAALEDPFLADALEGYAFSKNPEKELAEIGVKLEGKKKREQVPLRSLAQKTWWKVAAIFIIIAGAGYLFITINSSPEHPLALKTERVKKEEPEMLIPKKSDTTITPGDIAFEKPVPKKQINKSATPIIKPVQTPESGNTVQKQPNANSQKDLSTEHFVKKKENPLAINQRSKRTSLIDSGERPYFRSSNPRDSSNLLAISPTPSPGESESVVVVMNKDTAPLEEVVVTAYGNKRRTQSRKDTGILKALNGKVSGVHVDIALPYPKEGLEKFNQYIKDHAVPVLDSSGTRIPVNILLIFSLNKKGKPTHIKAPLSTCKACEKETIRLLKAGPRWVGKPGEQGKVRIQF